MENESKESESENHKPWNRWFRQAQDGDQKAVHNIIEASQPIIESLSKNPLYRKRLGRDEVYSNANYGLLKFIRKPKQLPEDAEVPFFLRFVLECELKDCLKNMKLREKFEQLAKQVNPKDSSMEEDYTDNDSNEAPSADKADEPETHYLNSELCDMVREAIQQLPENEKTVIHAFYYQHKGMKEIAQDMNCTYQNAYVTRRNAYTRLRKILKKTVYA